MKHIQSKLQSFFSVNNRHPGSTLDTTIFYVCEVSSTVVAVQQYTAVVLAVGTAKYFTVI